MWTCDVCGGAITHPREGLLVADGSLRYWRIVHKRRCDGVRDGPYHLLADFAKPSGVVREMFGIASGARLWQRMVKDGAFDHITAAQQADLRDRVFGPPFGHFALIAIAVNAMQICEAEQ